MHQEDMTRIKQQALDQQPEQLEQRQQGLIRQLNQLIKSITFNCSRASVQHLQQLIEVARGRK